MEQIYYKQNVTACIYRVNLYTWFTCAFLYAFLFTTNKYEGELNFSCRILIQWIIFVYLYKLYTLTTLSRINRYAVPEDGMF